MTNPIYKDEILANIMEDLGAVLIKHLDALPDAVLILRIDGICRTLFAGNPNNFAATENPRQVMTEVLEQAVAQNRQIGTRAPRRL